MAFTIKGLRVSFRPLNQSKRSQSVPAVLGVDISVEPGEVVGLVGESGSGKSVTSHAALGLLGKNAEVSGAVHIDGMSVLDSSKGELEKIRGTVISIVLQDPFGSLNPLLTVGRQVIETVRANRHVGRAKGEEIAVSLLRDVGLPDAVNLLKRYPHELSGGMCQRVVIATALAGQPQYLIADEATTALDVTVQAQVVELLDKLVQDKKMGVLFITHDLGVAAGICDRIVVMKNGKIVEEGDAIQILMDPQAPYTQDLLSSLPSNQTRASLADFEPRLGESQRIEDRK